MTRINIMALSAVLGVAACGAFGPTGSDALAREPASSEWQQEFNISKRTLVPTGRNPYLILEPGFQLVLEDEDEKLVITVLDDTVDVGGVTTRVVEEREWKDGQLIEVSRNFFAMCKETKDVFYFGEDVDDYRKGKVVGHGGAWRADSRNAKPGLIMPGVPKVGMKYYQEMAPGVAMDRAEVVSLKAKLKTPVRTFGHCLKTREGSALNPREKEYKLYAQGIGLIQEEDKRLVKYGFTKK